MKGYVFAVLAYLLPTFALGVVWHLVLFQSYYEALAIYRRDVIIPFGFLSMLIQAATFALVYEKAFARSRQSALQIAALRRCLADLGVSERIAAPGDVRYTSRGTRPQPRGRPARKRLARGPFLPAENRRAHVADARVSLAVRRHSGQTE